MLFAVMSRCLGTSAWFCFSPQDKHQRQPGAVTVSETFEGQSCHTLQTLGCKWGNWVPKGWRDLVKVVRISFGNMDWVAVLSRIRFISSWQPSYPRRRMRECTLGVSGQGGWITVRNNVTADSQALNCAQPAVGSCTHIISLLLTSI